MAQSNAVTMLWIYILKQKLYNHSGLLHLESIYHIVSNKHSLSNKRPPNLFSNKTR